ncbi:MAG: NUDIX hydrolase [Anaerolineae bacterium]
MLGDRVPEVEGTASAEFQRKAYAYITHEGRLLVFRHTDFPEAGIQVPGGTVEPGEDPAQAVMREACEETGLTELRLVAFLGEAHKPGELPGPDHRRYFYHLICGGTPPERWVHYEMNPSDGSPAPIEFEFFWVTLPDDVPVLSGALDEMLPALCRVHDCGEDPA